MMHVHLVFTEYPGEEFDQYQETFLYQEDAQQYVDNLNAEVDGTTSYFVRVKVN